MWKEDSDDVTACAVITLQERSLGISEPISKTLFCLTIFLISWWAKTSHKDDVFSVADGKKVMVFSNRLAIFMTEDKVMKIL